MTGGGLRRVHEDKSDNGYGGSRGDCNIFGARAAASRRLSPRDEANGFVVHFSSRSAAGPQSMVPGRSWTSLAQSRLYQCRKGRNGAEFAEDEQSVEAGKVGEARFPPRSSRDARTSRLPGALPAAAAAPRAWFTSCSSSVMRIAEIIRRVVLNADRTRCVSWGRLVPAPHPSTSSVRRTTVHAAKCSRSAPLQLLCLQTVDPRRGAE